MPLTSVSSLAFDFEEGEYRVLAQITQLQGTMHVYLTAAEHGTRLDNLTVAMQTPYEELPLTTSLMTSEDVQNDAWSVSLSQKLAKRLKSQLLVSCSLPTHYECIYALLEKELIKALSASD